MALRVQYLPHGPVPPVCGVGGDRARNGAAPVVMVMGAAARVVDQQRRGGSGVGGL
jgi:hypothetical protein